MLIPPAPPPKMHKREPQAVRRAKTQARLAWLAAYHDCYSWSDLLLVLDITRERLRGMFIELEIARKKSDDAIHHERICAIRVQGWMRIWFDRVNQNRSAA